MSAIPEISSYLPPFANRTTNPVIPQPVLPSLLPKTEVHQITGGLQGAQAYAMAPNSSELVLDAEQPLVWFVATDASGNKAVVQAYKIEAYTPPKPVTLEDLMAQMQTMNDRLVRLEGSENGEPDPEPVGTDQPGGTGNTAGK